MFAEWNKIRVGKTDNVKKKREENIPKHVWVAKKE